MGEGEFRNFIEALYIHSTYLGKNVMLMMELVPKDGMQLSSRIPVLKMV